MRLVFSSIFVFVSFLLFSQTKKVAITMDDMPFNVAPPFYDLEQTRAMNLKLLNKIEAAGAPVTAFFTGKGCLKWGETDERLEVLKAWIDHPLITPGNHTYSHSNYAQSSFEAFRAEVEKNEWLLDMVTDKKIPYFRFPYNATGKDSLTRQEMSRFLHKKDYQQAPFTLESVDYLYNTLYQSAIEEGQLDSAQFIAKSYIDFTVATFRYYEGVSEELFGRNITHIFLCHGNLLHADYYLELIEAIQKEGYTFISLQEALKDPIYQQTDHYYQKWGVSWIYRWIEDPEERMQWMRKGIEPEIKW